jgi:hypothetical protein
MKRAVCFVAFVYASLISYQSYSQKIALISEDFRYPPPHSIETENPYVFITNVYSYYNLKDDLKDIDDTFIRKHPIGTEVAKRIHLFEQTYTLFSEAAPGAFSDQKSVQKLLIYNSIHKIDKHFRKQLRTELVNQDEAEDQMCSILDTALILYHYNTDDFEQALKVSKSVDDMVRLFKQVQIVESMH